MRKNKTQKGRMMKIKLNNTKKEARKALSEPEKLLLFKAGLFQTCFFLAFQKPTLREYTCLQRIDLKGIYLPSKKPTLRTYAFLPKNNQNKFCLDSASLKRGE